MIDGEWLESIGFKYENLKGESPYEWYKREDGLIFWDFNGEYWLCNQLDQGGIDAPFRQREQVIEFLNLIAKLNSLTPRTNDEHERSRHHRTHHQ